MNATKQKLGVQEEHNGLKEETPEKTIIIGHRSHKCYQQIHFSASETRKLEHSIQFLLAASESKQIINLRRRRRRGFEL